MILADLGKEEKSPRDGKTGGGATTNDPTLYDVEAVQQAEMDQRAILHIMDSLQTVYPNNLLKVGISVLFIVLLL